MKRRESPYRFSIEPEKYHCRFVFYFTLLLYLFKNYPYFKQISVHPKTGFEFLVLIGQKVINGSDDSGWICLYGKCVSGNSGFFIYIFKESLAFKHYNS